MAQHTKTDWQEGCWNQLKRHI